MQISIARIFISPQAIISPSFPKFGTESQFIGYLELFWTKKVLLSALNFIGGNLCGDIISERSKI